MDELFCSEECEDKDSRLPMGVLLGLLLKVSPIQEPEWRYARSTLNPIHLTDVAYKNMDKMCQERQMSNSHYNGHQQLEGNYSTIICGDKHCFGTYFLHLPSTELGCRGCGASWALWTDRWLGFCANQDGSEVEGEGHLHLEAAEISTVQKKININNTRRNNLQHVFHIG